MAGLPGTLLHRKLRGPMADWGVPEMLLRQIEFRLAGANWQRAGGKSARPTPVELPGSKPTDGSGTREPAEVRRLRNLGLIPADDD